MDWFYCRTIEMNCIVSKLMNCLVRMLNKLIVDFHCTYFAGMDIMMLKQLYCIVNVTPRIFSVHLVYIHITDRSVA